MADAIGRLLPLAVALAISSVPILVTVLILLSPNARRSAFPFLIGFVAGVAGVFAGCIALAQVIPVRVVRHPQEALGIALIVIGAALVVLAVVGGVRSLHAEASGVPRWMSLVSGFGPLRSAGLGVLLCFRPKSILLCAAAGLSVRGERLSPGELGVLVTVFTLLAASTVIAPIVVAAASPEHAQNWLTAMRHWIEKNSSTVTTVILLIIGVVVVGDGLTRL
ncbi:GAP family protein [Herbiconiux ginsengi]|uniref:Sap, sulfolipid-1-addressing protein n=1 Tax=Herbiconiux ginsengi TaxID=381665 RepID=A0A1H3PJI7_9MICO|nr:GAP family protein [Herbiconiux ginsengi]SDZ00599.1 Sap, sulfolipid-1-addressing protein [Herbiconiux ginsengi]